MKEDENIKTFQEKKNLIYDMLAKIRGGGEQAIKLMNDVCHIYVPKHDPVPGLNLGEEQVIKVINLLKEINKIYQEINQNLKKITELIEANETLVKPLIPTREYPEEHHCGRIG